MNINIDKIKRNCSILDACSDLGFTVMRAGKYYSIKEHDSVRIHPTKNIFIQNSTGKGGTVIDFYMQFSNLTFMEVISKLTEENKNAIEKSSQVSPKNETVKEIKKELRLPERDTNIKNVYAYLVGTRCIDKSIVSDFIMKKMLYQDTHKNCVFVSYKDRNPEFAMLRGTNTSKRFIGDVSGSNYDYSFFIDNKASNLVISESVIDAMSIMSLLKSQGKDYLKNDYLALTGIGKYESVYMHLEEKNYESVLICLDNDEPGKSAAIKIEKDILRKQPDINVRKILPLTGKDFNEYIQVLKGNSIKNPIDKAIVEAKKVSPKKINEKNEEIDF